MLRTPYGVLEIELMFMRVYASQVPSVLSLSPSLDLCYGLYLSSHILKKVRFYFLLMCSGARETLWYLLGMEPGLPIC